MTIETNTHNRPIRKIKLYPGQDSVYEYCRPWMNVIVDNDAGDELWIDSNRTTAIDFDHEIFENIKRVCFYDFFHAPTFLQKFILDRIYSVSKIYPTKWYTCNAKSVSAIECERFDFIWNWVKRASVEQKVGWKHAGDNKPYQRSQIHWHPRNKKYLSLNRNVNNFRRRLINTLESKNGYLSDLTRNLVISSEGLDDQLIRRGLMIPPDRKFFDDSYVSCQVESQYLGNNSVIFTEKTYDHLVRGRIVLNFGPQDYYKCLEKDGWRLPSGIDLSWDSESDSEKRFQGYLNTLNDLLDRSLDDIHGWFLDQKEIIEHNYSMLETKPYDFID